MIYLELFWAFLQIGLFSIGGGYAAIPLIQQQVVYSNSWLSLSEFADIITISQMTPGPIAINTATFVGTKVAGLGGSIAATMGYIVPSCIIMSLIFALYKKYKRLPLIQGILGGLRPVVVGLIASAGLSIFVLSIWNGETPSLSLSVIGPVALGIFAAALFILRKLKPNPIFVMLGAGVVGYIFYGLLGLPM